MPNINSILVKIQEFIPPDSMRGRLDKNILNTLTSKENINNHELLEFYQYCDGNNYTVNNHYNGIKFCSFGYLLTISDAIQIYNSETFSFKQKKLFPVIADFAGDYLLVSTDKEDSCVYIYSPGLFIIEPEVIFSSLASFFNAILSCYLSNAYTISNNELIEDFDTENAILCECDLSYSNWSQ